jgi:hypothetical protein
MSSSTVPNSKKRLRLDDEIDEDLDDFGKKAPPPAPLSLPGGYQDGENPFNDAQLSAPFQWKLRNSKLAKEGKQVVQSEEEERMIRESTIKEIELLRQKRLERERAEAEWEAEQARLAREREQLLSAGWERDEDRFLLSQLKMLALKRLQELRPHSIDLLFLIYAAYMRLLLKQHDVKPEPPKTSVEQQLQTLESGLVLPKNLPSPESILRDISLVEDCKSLTEDIQLFYLVESDPKSTMNVRFEELKKASQPKGSAGNASTISSASSYWSAMQVLVDEREKELMAKNTSSGAPVAADIILPEVQETIDAMMIGKTMEELREIEQTVDVMLQNQDASVPIDDEYWRSVLVRLKYYKAMVHVNSVYNLVLKDIRDNPNANAKTLPSTTRIVASSSAGTKSAEKFNEDGFEEVEEGTEDRGAPSDELGVSTFGTDEAPLDEETMLKMERAKGLGKDEEAFGEEEAALGPTDADMRAEIRKTLHGFQLGDKFRPRKPKYFNRVKTGFEWTKYNQIHYDYDNPPPKVVQGYKFTIFYPDLIDPTKAPGFAIEKTESPDFVILRFHAGPPYIDIAFRIVNKEWSVAPKHGFKCLFARGVLYLWFNFKRLRYRR